MALDRVNLSIPQGQICCIFGESGSGKSTLLNQLAGMEKPTRGGVRIGGVPVSKLDERELAAFRQKHLGFVFQSYNLLPNLTALENVAMPLMFRGVPKEQRERAARGVLKRVGLGHRLSHYPRQMSGGQQQRVGIARAFVTKPEVVFADEPTGNLDSKTKTEVMTMIRNCGRYAPNAIENTPTLAFVFTNIMKPPFICFYYLACRFLPVSNYSIIIQKSCVKNNHFWHIYHLIPTLL